MSDHSNRANGLPASPLDMVKLVPVALPTIIAVSVASRAISFVIPDSLYHLVATAGLLAPLLLGFLMGICYGRTFGCPLSMSWDLFLLAVRTGWQLGLVWWVLYGWAEILATLYSNSVPLLPLSVRMFPWDITMVTLHVSMGFFFGCRLLRLGLSKRGLVAVLTIISAILSILSFFGYDFDAIKGVFNPD